MDAKQIIIGAVERYFQFDKTNRVLELKDISNYFTSEDIDESLNKAAKFYEKNQYYLDRYTESMQGEIVRSHLNGIDIDLTKDVSTDFIIDELTKIKKYSIREENLLKRVKEECGYNDTELSRAFDTTKEQIVSWEFDPSTLPILVKNYILALIEVRNLKKDAEKYRKIKTIVEE